jgi:ABC-type transport system involved in cytochrome c biogenesis ATPase subunit
LIYLSKASKSIKREHNTPVRVLDGVSVQIPTDQIVSIYAMDAGAGSSFMKIISGLKRLDSGRVQRRLRSLSPLMNADGVAGATQFGTMTLAEQVRWYARTNRSSERELVAFINKICDVAAEWRLPIYAIEWYKRRGIELAAISSVPFDCYVIDRFELLEPLYRALLLKTCEVRRAGLIFSTNSSAPLCEQNCLQYELADGAIQAVRPL